MECKRSRTSLLLVPLGLVLFLVRYAQGQGPGFSVSGPTMRSREADMRIQFEIPEGKPAGTVVGTIPTKPNFVYRFNDVPREFVLNGTTGTITTTMEVDREALRIDRFDLVVLSSQPTYPIEVRIVILDVNDNAPVFPEPSLNISFSENANIGTRVILDTATDGDAGLNDVTTDYNIVSGNEGNKFRLVVTTNPSGETPYLHLETTGQVDRETRSSYQLKISAQDGGDPPKFGYLQLNITVLDVNDNPPIFDHSDYSVSLNESVPPGTSVLQVRATDNDDGDNARISYFLSETETQFVVDPQTGVILTNDVLNCQKNCPPLDKCPKSCVFTVFARDHGSPRQDGRAYVTVNLVDTNDHDPIIRFRFFPTTATHATVDENAQNGSVVAAVSVIDLDEGPNGDTFVEILGGNELAHFRLEATPSFDIVRVNGVLDREQISKYNLTITATDRGVPPKSSTAFLIIHVNDVNDHEPVFEKNEYSAILSELVPAGTYVAGITATDEDTGINSNIYYFIMSGNDRRWFNIDIQTGLVTTTQNLDRETQDFVELKISARDGGPNPRYTHTLLKIQILDENDEPPLFSMSFVNASLSENAPPNSLFSVVSAIDNDLGTNGSVVYSLHEEVLMRYPDAFHLDPTYGRLTTKKRLDRETISTYLIKVIARDQGIVPLSSTATIQLNVLDANDNAPEFYPRHYLARVDPESPPGTEVVQVTATDKDEGKNAALGYFIVSGADGKFDIDESTGVIRSRSQLNRHLKSRYEIITAVSNPGDKEVSQTATVIVFVVDVHQNHIQFGEPEGYNFVIEEDPKNQGSNIGREVGRLSLARTTSSTGIKYSISSGDPYGWFAIDERTGVITTAKPVDREVQAVSMLLVVAYGPSHFTETYVNITIRDVNDCPPEFDNLLERVDIFENWPAGHEVYLAKATDLDEGINSAVEYSLSDESAESFTIDKTSGMVYLSKPLRLEPGKEYIIEVLARDLGRPSLSATQQVSIIVLDVNDHTPAFDHLSYETSLLESTSVNDRFFSVSATDADQGENGRVSYKIEEGNEDNKFGIFPDGYLYVKNPLDREIRDYYGLTVVARDNGTKPRTSSVPVVIHLIDENDNSPQFENQTFTFYIPENEIPDSYVGKLLADDKDKGRNAELTYSISSNQHDFVVDPKTGLIRTLREFDREKLMEISGHDYIVMEALVLDGGLTRLRDEAKVIVYVTDVNDNPPVFIRTPYRTSISEGAPLKTQVIRVSATDADYGLNGNVLYSIVDGNKNLCFDIDESSGQINVAKTLDRERTQHYLLTILARDTGDVTAHTSTVTVTIDVLDENDNSPVFLVSRQEVEIPETTSVGYRLFNFSATDADMGANGEVTFSIAAGNIKETFKIDPMTGVLYLVRPLDFEEQSIFHLNVTANDGGSPRMTATIPFSVRVLDVNDNPPAFPNVAIVRQIEEGIPPNTPVVTVTADDRDSGRNGKVVYSISQQDPPGHHFDIRKETGVIFTSQKIDREFSDSFKLTVQAKDLAMPENSRLSAEKTVTIIVEDINDNAPTFVSMDTGVIPEGAERGHVIMILSAMDADANTNGVVTYDLLEGRSSDLFYLDRTSGELYLSRPVEKPAVTYQLTIQATDEAVLSQRKSSRNKITVIGVSRRQDGPVFTASEYSGSVFENEPAGSSVLTVRASYPGGEKQGGSVEYFLTGINSDGLAQQRVFAINRQSGVIATATVLDRETGARVYELEVYAVDITSSQPKTSKCKATITVLDKNDSPPVFPQGSYRFAISEDAPAASTVATVAAVDPDSDSQLLYSLLDNDTVGEDSKFALDSSTGLLTLQEPLDREKRPVHQLAVRADDGVQYADCLVTIEVTDTNDNPPVFEEPVYSFDIPEDAQRGAQVGALGARDTDVGINGQISYTVLSDWGNDVFSINPQTGVFTLTSHLDYEQSQHYVFVVQAQDSGQPPLSSTVTVYFNVLDLNDNAPIFDPMSYSDEIPENVTVGTSVLRVTATDLDSGENGMVIYNIVEGNEQECFSISQNGTLYTNKALDRETQSLYNLVVSATDRAWPLDKRLSSTVQVAVILKDVNDMAPEFVTPKAAAIVENVPVNTVIMAVKAVDRDEGRNSYVEYNLAAQSDSKFTVGTIDGLLRVNGPLDREMKSKYAVTVVAKDRGYPPKSSSVEILVTILDENDNSPIFDPKQYSGSVPENASIGLSVLQVSATDEDEALSGQVRYSIIAGDSNHDFVIGEDTGIIRVNKNLDYERKNRYVLTVQAEDGGQDTRHDTATVSVVVTDVNDNPPTFLDSPYEVHIMENEENVPVSLLTVRGIDADLLPNNNIHYLIKDGDKDLFRINATSGELSLLKSLDRELMPEHVLTILAMDSGSPRQTGTGTVTVVVSDLNDNSPVFERNHQTVTVMENLPAGTQVITVSASDPDDGRNSKLRYTLEGPGVDKFEVDPQTGTVLTRYSLDREEGARYELSVVAHDGGLLQEHSASAALTVLVGDKNDNQPQFSSSKYTVYIPDDAAGGHFVLGAQAEDPDVDLNSRIVYHLSGTDADKFQINQDTGVIKLVQKLSEKTVAYHMEIFATDNGETPLSSSTNVEVYLSPSARFPSFRQGVRNFKCPESAENVYITTVSASSPKPGKEGKIHYRIAGGNLMNPFRIDSETGELQVKGGLDHETFSEYELWIEGRDSGEPPLASAVQLNILIGDSNDNAPVFAQEYYNASVGEEQYPPQLVLVVEATDADSGDNGKISYQFLNPQGQGNPFSLDAQTGKIQTNAVLDREKIETYQMVVTAVDHGTPKKTGTATIYVTVLDKNDNPPRFTRLFSVNVTENTAIGTFVIQVTSSDKDIEVNGKAMYSFTENPGGKFFIDPVTGNVTVAGWIDREVKDEYLLKVAAVDGSWRAETPLTITVQDLNDNSPEFSSTVYTFNIPELQSAITFVGQVSASDHDKSGPNAVISYSLKRPSDYFRIDPSSGELLSKQVLHYRRSSRGFSPENQHVLYVVATDHGKPPLSSEVTVIINVVDSNNNAPQFEKSTYMTPVPDSVPVGSLVLQMVSADKEDVGVNAQVEYTVVGGNGTEYFSIHKNTGWITVTSPLLGNRGRYYQINVIAADNGVPPKSSEASVTFVLTGENKFGPVFAALSYQVSIAENEPLGSEIATVSSTDADTGLNGVVYYSIAAGNDEETFEIGEATGIVTLLKPLDYEVLKEYHLNITATDRAFHSKSTTAMLTVIVSDVNDNAPLFNQSVFNAYVSENQPAKTIVTQLIATDIDSKKNSVIKYSLVGDAGKEPFAIDSHTGVLTTKISFDYEERDLYQVEVVATNPGTSQYSSTKLNVHITGRNEFYPKFVQQVFQFTVSESSPLGTTVGLLQATDEDSGRDGQIFFLLVGSSNERGFKLNQRTGAISVTRNLDRESQARVVLSVLAKNWGSIRGNDTDEAQVVISIQDGNDPPVFSRSIYEARVGEDAAPGTSVLTVLATDKDVRPNNNQFMYSIIENAKSPTFSIDANSGLIQTAGTLDRETVPFYNITVAAIDSGSPPQTGTALVMVIVEDVNDNGPVFEPSEVVGYVMENEPPFTSVMVLSATDKDLPPNGAPYMYFLVGGEHRSYFEVDRHSGLLRTTQSLNREVTPSIVLTVEVHDSGVPQRKSRHPVTVVVLDENDTPSTPRSLMLLVWTYNNFFPGGKIANVHPLDQDATGQFQCYLLHGDSSIFNIPSKCDLHVSRMQNTQNYTIQVSGNDGKHSNVTSTVYVKFMSFENQTMTNSVTLRFLNQTAKDFLSEQFELFQKTLVNLFHGSGHPVLYSITAINEHTEVTLAVKTPRGSYVPAEEVLAKLRSKPGLAKGREFLIGYDPCENSPCQNGASCRTFLDFQESLSITDSPSLVFASPTVSRQYRCECPQGYSGSLCQYQNDPCSPDPCLNKGACQHDGLDFECICPPQYDGKKCEDVRKDSCSSNPCKNGGSCEEAPDRSFFCLCRPGFKGSLCEQAADSCRPNRCMNGGTCMAKKPGYECVCESNFFGRHCEKSTYGFESFSYLSLPSLHSSTNDLSITFATNRQGALLFYSFGPQAGGRSDFLALELDEGKPRFSFGGSRTAIAVVKGDRKLADGKWHKVTVIRNGKVASLSVADCTHYGETCEECPHDNTTCSFSVQGHTGSLNFDQNPLYVGGVPSAEPLLERPGQVENDDFVGCVHSVSVSGRQLDLRKGPIKSHRVSLSCGRKADMCSASGQLCGERAACLDLWDTVSCTCPPGVRAPNCKEALEPYSLGSDSYLQLIPQENYIRLQLGSWKSTRQGKKISFTFRTNHATGVLLATSAQDKLNFLYLRDGQLHLVQGPPSDLKAATLSGHARLSDGYWHTVQVHQAPERGSKVNITLDDRLISDGQVTDVLDPYMIALHFGGHPDPVRIQDQEIPGFQGCLQQLTVNNEVQTLNWTRGFFSMSLHGSVRRGCLSDVLGLGADQTDPLGIGVVLVIVFFVILIVVILVSFLVFRKRKLRRDKHPGHMKPGGPFLASGSDNPRRNPDAGYDGASTDDILRGHMPQDLVPKKLKDREIERPQRPDIIEREVINRSPISPIPRMDEPPCPEPVKSQYGVHGLENEPPEHYDLENASSIAPSDIDIVYHYKGFRDGNIRKYKANPHVPSYHKHNHRHSPHSFQASPVRESPRNVLRQSPNPVVPRESPSVMKMQNTPLARLSPSSELSQQTPRILTLQDISGKPLQTALLATSQGVGPKELRDPMTNSERSLNSPVSNLSQSTGSMNSGPQPVGKKKDSTLTLGLTAEEIERLNSRPRNSSLVSTLDAVSSSSDDNTEKNKLAELLETNTELLEAPDSSTDESGNDSFTCSEFEYDNNYDKVHRDFGPGNMIFSKLAEEDNENDEDSGKTYDGFDSFRGSLSTLVASDDDLSNLSSYKPPNGSMLGWDYLLNWGPNFQSLVGVFKDIAELPDTMSGAPGHGKPSEEYV